METVEHQRSAKKRRLSSNDDEATTPVDVKDLPQVFYDTQEVKEFNGFTKKEKASIHKETSSKEVKKKKSSSTTKHLRVKRYIIVFVCSCVQVCSCVHVCSTTEYQ